MDELERLRGSGDRPGRWRRLRVKDWPRRVDAHALETGQVGGGSGEVLRYSEIRPDDAELPRAGNRYDVSGGKVLYAATQVRACFGETLARLRPTPLMREILAEEGQGKNYMVCGTIPQDWRLQRVIGALHVSDALPFLDVEHPGTHAFLSQKLSSKLVTYGYPEDLDVADIRNSDRRLSRAIAHYAYTAVDDEGLFIYSGIRYLSRVNTDWECWAIFDGNDLYETSRRGIEVNDPDLQAIAQIWDLHVF